MAAAPVPAGRRVARRSRRPPPRRCDAPDPRREPFPVLRSCEPPCRPVSFRSRHPARGAESRQAVAPPLRCLPETLSRSAKFLVAPPANREIVSDMSKYDPDLSLLFHARSEEHTSELQSLMRISYAVFCLKKKKTEQIS